MSTNLCITALVRDAHSGGWHIPDTDEILAVEKIGHVKRLRNLSDAQGRMTFRFLPAVVNVTPRTAEYYSVEKQPVGTNGSEVDYLVQFYKLRANSSTRNILPFS